VKKKQKEPELLKLDLGAGDNPSPGFKGVDKYAEKADYKFDLFKFPWPFKDGSVDELHSNQFFEHIPQNLRIPFMDECYRVLKVGAKFTVIAPYYTSMRAIQDPTHEWPPISEATFLYFNKKWREDNKLTHYLGKCDFDFTYGYNISAEWNARNDEAKMFAIKHYNNVVTDIQVVLTKRAK
jgi:ubiquinone/menaquinone biosynthesis C-methylase UbiE